MVSIVIYFYPNMVSFGVKFVHMTGFVGVFKN